MQINTIKRPWEKKQQKRYNPDPYYQSKGWKNLRSLHRSGFTLMPDGFKLHNIFCVDCYKEHKIFKEGPHCDHIIPRKDGGTDTLDNLQTQCDTHHASKSAKEGNNKRKIITK